MTRAHPTLCLIQIHPETDVQITLRPSHPDDLEWLDPLYESMMRPYVELTHPWDEHKFRDTFSTRNSSIIRLNGEDIGLLKVEPREDCICLGDIQIHPAHQGKGIGSSLIEELKTRSDREGLPIRLRVLKGNPARSLYERLGFVEIDELDNCHQLEYRPAVRSA